MSLMQLMNGGLPINRKERFYTGTVFPMLVCQDGFRYFSRFTALIPDCQQVSIDISLETANIQFFTEYNLVESIAESDKSRFHDVPAMRDTPDIIIYIEGVQRVLIAIEAKLFLAPSAGALGRQMRNQGIILEFLVDKLEIDELHHCALVPEAWRSVLSQFPYPVITWEQLYEQYRQITPHNYFLEVLRIALEKYPELVSRSTTSGKNSFSSWLGAEIYADYQSGTGEIRLVGRGGGLNGARLMEDISTDQWRTQQYEVSKDETPPNGNWFYVEDFIRLIDEHTGDQN